MSPSSSSGDSSFAVLFGHFSLSSANFILKLFGQVSNSPPTFPVRWTPSLARNSCSESRGPGKQILLWHHRHSQLFPTHMLLSLPNSQPSTEKGVENNTCYFVFFLNLISRTSKSLNIDINLPNYIIWSHFSQQKSKDQCVQWVWENFLFLFWVVKSCLTL